VLKAIEQQPGADFGELASIIKRTAFKVTRMGELAGRVASEKLGVPFGIVDLSLAPTPAQGDSVARILEEMGLERIGTHGSTAALATTLLLSGVTNCVGIGFQRGTHTNWQMVQNDAAGAPTLTDLGASFAINTTDVLTLFIGAAPNASSIGVRVVNETSGAVFEATITTDMPAATIFLSPRNYMNNGTAAAAVAFDCAGVYVETDF
jgi:hypothetical protein